MSRYNPAEELLNQFSKNADRMVDECYRLTSGDTDLVERLECLKDKIHDLRY